MWQHVNDYSCNLKVHGDIPMMWHNQPWKDFKLSSTEKGIQFIEEKKNKPCPLGKRDFLT